MTFTDASIIVIEFSRYLAIGKNHRIGWNNCENIFLRLVNQNIDILPPKGKLSLFQKVEVIWLFSRRARAQPSVTTKLFNHLSSRHLGPNNLEHYSPEAPARDTYALKGVLRCSWLLKWFMSYFEHKKKTYARIYLCFSCREEVNIQYFMREIVLYLHFL